MLGEGEVGTGTQMVGDRRDRVGGDKLYCIVAGVAEQATWGQA